MQVHTIPSPSPNSDSNFRSSPPWLYYVSAPTSPNRTPDFYREFDQPDDFAFHFSKEDAKSIVSAEQLFHGGKIRPLLPQESAFYGAADVETTTSLRSPLLSSSSSPTPSNSKEDTNGSKSRKTIWSAFTPKSNKQTSAHAPRSLLDNNNNENINHRGRERAPHLSMSASRRRGTRSLSPIRIPDYPQWEDDDPKKKKEPNSSSTTTLNLVQVPLKSSRMTKLKNFLLFRSASEGRGSSKIMRSNVAVSAHERHYTMKKAANEDLKKKTYLPYKRGILGR